MIVVPYVVIERKSVYDRFIGRGYSKDEMSDLASGLAEKYEKLYLADENGIVRNKPELDLARVVCEEIPTLYEGGVRFANNVIDMIVTGAEKAVIGTATLASLDELRGAFKLSENITFKVDYGDGILSFDHEIAGRAFLDLTSDVSEIGVKEIIVPSKLASEAAAAKKKLGFKLGVLASLSEVRPLEELGADYIITEDFGGLDKDE